MQGITKNTPTGNITIQGILFSVAKPFAEGHTCTANEAAALNQVLAENVRNNLATQVKKAKDEANGEPDETALQTLVNDYVAGYEFGVRSGGGRTMDPVVKEARNIGKEKIKAALAAKGVAAKDITAEQMRSLLDKYWDTHGEQWMADAKAVVKARQKAAATTLDDIELPPAEAAE